MEYRGRDTGQHWERIRDQGTDHREQADASHPVTVFSESIIGLMIRKFQPAQLLCQWQVLSSDDAE